MLLLAMMADAGGDIPEALGPTTNMQLIVLLSSAEQKMAHPNNWKKSASMWTCVNLMVGMIIQDVYNIIISRKSTDSSHLNPKIHVHIGI